MDNPTVDMRVEVKAGIHIGKIGKIIYAREVYKTYLVEVYDTLEIIEVTAEEINPTEYLTEVDPPTYPEGYPTPEPDITDEEAPEPDITDEEAPDV